MLLGWTICYTKQMYPLWYIQGKPCRHAEDAELDLVWNGWIVFTPQSLHFIHVVVGRYGRCSKKDFIQEERILTLYLLCSLVGMYFLCRRRFGLWISWKFCSRKAVRTDCKETTEKSASGYTLLFCLHWRTHKQALACKKASTADCAISCKFCCW
jgi:hypothetical protein